MSCCCHCSFAVKGFCCIHITSKFDCRGAGFALPKSGPVGMTLNGQVYRRCSDDNDHYRVSVAVDAYRYMLIVDNSRITALKIRPQHF
jgi:hypothetical protein